MNRCGVWLVLTAGCATHAPGSMQDPGETGSPEMPGDVPAGSRCMQTGDELSCTYLTAALGTTAPRDVHYMVPEGTPPTSGWPVAILFQGSFVSAERAWSARVDETFGAYHQTRLVRDLLDAGFAVLTPEARYNGSTFWDTNTVAWGQRWQASPDHALMEDLFAAIDGGTFGPLASSNMVAAGISSGGYMSSRVGITYPERFAAIAIHSASYMTCSGALCSVPDQLPADHPPTLFLQGGADHVAPMDAARSYYDALVADGIAARWVVDPDAGHEWIEAAPAEALAWFSAHP